MYKLLIVDDEDIERESMEMMIPWERLGIQVIATAWNGIEGLEKVISMKPDLVITDIKMPVMNGIELIRKSREITDDIIFIVLSGYGEYEFTSQAMELGVRHYILKPSDESRIMETVLKAVKELEQERHKRAAQHQFRYQKRRLEPRAREQMFRNVLLGKEQAEGEYASCLSETGQAGAEVFLLQLTFSQPPDYLEQFALTNIFGEIAGSDNILLTTAIDTRLYYLLPSGIYAETEPVMEKLNREFNKFFQRNFLWQSTGFRPAMEVRQQYLELTQEHHDQRFWTEGPAAGGSGSYEDRLFELALLLIKMDIKGVGLADQRHICRQFADQSGQMDGKCRAGLDQARTTEELRAAMFALSETVKQDQMNRILAEIYRNISEIKLSIHWLAGEVLFLSEDYLGRLFYRSAGTRYSDYVMAVRIALAQRLMKEEPELKVSVLAECVGYAADGQYFSKVFKKVTGKSPTEYKDVLKQETGC